MPVQPFGYVNLLEASNLKLTRQERVLFEALSFTAAPGSLVVVEGANGAGKTSLLRILAGLTPAEEGDVRWRGREIRGCRSAFNAEFAYVGHGLGVKLNLTPEENLQVVGGLTAGGNASVDHALDRLALSAHAAVRCAQLSAGQRRKVALARLLIRDARLWILDEPYTALDRATIETVDGMIRAHLAAGGVAVMTSHQTVGLDAANRHRIRLGDD